MYKIHCWKLIETLYYAKGERSSSGLLEWESINDAMEALAMMNHYQMKNPSRS